MNNEQEMILKEKRAAFGLAGGIDSITAQHRKGKLTARERIKYLFDDDTFMEIGAFSKHHCTDFQMDTTEVPYDGVITGFGKINGRLVYAFAQDFTIQGGSLGKMHALKIINIMKLALENGAPLAGLNDSGGARIQEGVDSMSGYGEIFYYNTMASGVIPQISAIMGPCAGGAAYSPALTDFILMVESTSKMFLTGPNVIKAVTGEEVTAEALGGADSQTMKSGVAHLKYVNDQECLENLKVLLSYLPQNNREETPVFLPQNNTGEIPELNFFLPEKTTMTYDMRVIIRKISDDGGFFEISPQYAQNLVVGFIRIEGRTIGVVASQPKAMAGCLDINSSDKGSRFIRICDAYNIPLLSMVDVPGFLPGTSQEWGGVIRHGAKLLYAFSEATVPKITLIIRKAYGGAYLGMCSKDLGADLVLAWPSAEIAVMGAEGAANIIFRKDIEGAENPEGKRDECIDDYRKKFMNPYIAASKNYVDDVILPSETRMRLKVCYQALSKKKKNLPYKKHGIMPV